MSDYIERRAFRKQLIDRQITTAFFNNEQRHEIGCIVEMLDNAPVADVVEVVRCKDCKHFTEGMAVGMCKRIPDKPIIPMPYNAFCAFGERKDHD